MTCEINKDEVQFVNEGPTVPYDKMYKCFENNGNGLLFRLVNTEKKQWAFYNDTADTVMRVHVKLAAGSKVKPLRRARMHALNADANEKSVTSSGTGETTAAAWESEVTLEVEPFRTELLLEGTVTGFSMDFKTEAAPATDVVFTYRRPTETYDKIYKCFKNNGNGLLFRLVNTEKKQWWFYNDTREYVMKVTVEFANRDEIKPLGKTTADENMSRSRADAIVYVLLIEPGKTEPFIEGTPDDYTLRFAAEPVNNSAPMAPDEVNYINGAPDPAMVPSLAQCKVYKCFKNNGNGLLFRIVDEANKQWFFYNDTREYIMTASVHVPAGQTYTPCEGAVTRPDPDEEGTTIVSMDIPPVTTCCFLRGLPRSFSLSFAAESANRSQPEASPQYENGKPDRTIIEYDEVYKCFKDRGNGLLFRLVDTAHQRWAFYNDTTNLHFTVRVAFENMEAVVPLGNTQQEDDADMGGRVFVCTIAPQTTEAFAAGDMSGYSIKFGASSKA